MSRYKATCKFKYENDADMLMQVNMSEWIYEHNIWGKTTLGAT